MKHRAYLASVQGLYGENAYLPYSAGLLWAYAASFPEVLDDWELGGLLYQKEPIDRTLSRIEGPDLLGLSSYLWNWEWNLALAQAVKRRWPDCRVLVGGPHIQENSPVTLERHSDLDLAIFGEGEQAFVELLRHWGDWHSVPQLAWREGGDIAFSTERRYADVEALRSPYLDGTFEPLLADRERWQVAQETNRGCPYHCTMCAWGRSALDKVRKLPMDRVLGEIDWFAAHETAYVDNCDANFGILPRDQEIVAHLVETKQRTGYPTRFRTSWAKNSNQRVFDLASALNGADMLKAVTLSMQSMDDRTLQIIRRKNIRYDDLSGLVQSYNAAGIPTYTELIVGLPGETLSSYVAGIDRVLEAGQHDGLFCYPLVILPNTEMDEPSYRAEHGLETATCFAMLSHGTPDPDAPRERQEYVVATKTLSRPEWERAVLFGYIVQALHCCGLTQHAARESESTYSEFYSRILDWALSDPGTVIGFRVAEVERLLKAAIDHDGTWDLVDERFGPTSWPPEEWIFLQCAVRSEQFYDQLARVIDRDLVEKQRRIFVPPEPGREDEYARDVVWYGRKGSGARLRTKTE